MAWTKTVKPTSSFSKTAKPTANFTKVAKAFPVDNFVFQDGNNFVFQDGNNFIFNIKFEGDWTKQVKPSI